MPTKAQKHDFKELPNPGQDSRGILSFLLEKLI